LKQILRKIVNQTYRQSEVIPTWKGLIYA